MQVRPSGTGPLPGPRPQTRPVGLAQGRGIASQKPPREKHIAGLDEMLDKPGHRLRVEEDTADLDLLVDLFRHEHHHGRGVVLRRILLPFALVHARATVCALPTWAHRRRRHCSPCAWPDTLPGRRPVNEVSRGLCEDGKAAGQLDGLLERSFRLGPELGD